VIGLTRSTVTLAFGSGADLQLPATTTRDAPIQPTAVERPEPVTISPPAAPDDLSRSESLTAKDKDHILRHFRTMYVDAEKATWFDSEQMRSALGRNEAFAALRIDLVDNWSLADVVLLVSYTYPWDFPYSLVHQNTTLVLVTGKGSGPFSAPTGARDVARDLVKRLGPYRVTAPAKPTKR
jgi:hypothetical protein